MLEVFIPNVTVAVSCMDLHIHAHMKVAGHIAMLTLEEVVAQSSWMMSSVAQVPANY